MLCGGFKEVSVSRVLNKSGVSALVDSKLGVVKLGLFLHVVHPMSRDCFGSDTIMKKVSIKLLYLP